MGEKNTFIIKIRCYLLNVYFHSIEVVVFPDGIGFYYNRVGAGRNAIGYQLNIIRSITDTEGIGALDAPSGGGGTAVHRVHGELYAAKDLLDRILIRTRIVLNMA